MLLYGRISLHFSPLVSPHTQLPTPFLSLLSFLAFSVSLGYSDQNCRRLWKVEIILSRFSSVYFVVRFGVLAYLTPVAKLSIICGELSALSPSLLVILSLFMLVDEYALFKSFFFNHCFIFVYNANFLLDTPSSLLDKSQKSSANWSIS